MQKDIQNIDKTLTHRVITLLERKELEFLDKLGEDALFSTGHKLSYTEILKALIDFAMEMRLSGEKIDSLETLKEKIIQQMLARIKEPQAKADDV